MLINFHVENFLSFKDANELSMACVKSFKEHFDTHTISINQQSSLLKTAIVYGNNAGGKSNLVRSMAFMKSMVLNSYRNALSDESFTLEKFCLNTASLQKPSAFEMSFIHEGTKYRYGFELNDGIVVGEWLFHTTSKETYLFKRDFQQIEVNKSSFKEALGREADVKENVLFLSLLATNNKEISLKVVDWFKKLRFINGIYDAGINDFTTKKLKTDESFRNWVQYFVRYLEIAGVSSVEQDAPLPEMMRGMDGAVGMLAESAQRPLRPKKASLVTHHKQYDGDGLFVGTVDFELEKRESEGTKKLLYLLGPFYEALRQGFVVVIDELDARLHTLLTQRLLHFFHACNKKGAQMIGVVHDVSLLNKETFRRDQIWFVDKDQFGASHLRSLSEFKTDTVRKESAFDSNYLAGTYGAVPYFEADEKLTTLLYGEG